jgi:hypothetical protein
MQLAPGQTQAGKLYIDTDAILGYLSQNRGCPVAPSGAPFLALLPFAVFGIKRRIRWLLLIASLGAVSLIACSGKYPASIAPGTYVVQVNAASPGSAASVSTPLTLLVTE